VWWLIVLATLAAAAACGDSDAGQVDVPPSEDGGRDADSEGDADGGNASVPLDEYWNRSLEADCRNTVSCGPVGEWGVMWGGSVESCLEWHRVFSFNLPPMVYWQEAVDRGTATWNGELAAACLEFAAALPCDLSQAFGSSGVDPLVWLHPECADMLAGSVPLDGTCYIDQECREGWCDKATACPGTCMPPTPDGESCIRSSECVPRSCCDYWAGSSCVPFDDGASREGEPCGEGGPWCVRDTWCDPSAHVCGARLAEGAVCQVWDTCEQGLICDSRMPCVRVTLLSEVGAACDGATSRCDPAAGLACVGGTCVAWGEVDDSCGWYGPSCHEGLACTAASGICLALRPDGVPCIDEMQCTGGACVDGLCGRRSLCY
jgi:hypothetical protein